jgi:hypothetical protein
VINVARLSRISILFQIRYFQAKRRALWISLKSCWRAFSRRSTTSWRLVMAQRTRYNKNGGVGSVRGLTEVMAMEGIFFWCAVTPTSARRHCEQDLCTVSALPMRRSKNAKSAEKKLYRASLRDRKPPHNWYSTEPGHKLCKTRLDYISVPNP